MTTSSKKVYGKQIPIASREIKAFLKAGAAKRLHLEQLPRSAPDLHPASGIWQYLKHVEVGNICCTDAGPLAQATHSGQRALTP